MLPAGAWVLAELVVARVHVTALVVRCAPSQVGGQRLTAAVVVAHVAVRTGADHGPDRYRVQVARRVQGLRVSHNSLQVLSRQACLEGQSS